MPISMQCPQCGKKLNAPDTAAGKRARCPQCKTIVTLPSPGAPPPAEEVFDAEPVQAPAPVPAQDERGFNDAAAYEPAPVSPAGRQAAGFRPPPFPGESDDIPLAPDAPPPLPRAGEAGPPRRPCPM